MKLGLIALAIALTGCGGSLEQARTAGKEVRVTGSESYLAKLDPHCRKLDNQRATWGGAAKGLGFISGSSGLATIPIDDEDKAAQTAVISTAVVVGAATVLSVYVAEQKAAAWARECSER